MVEEDFVEFVRNLNQFMWDPDDNFLASNFQVVPEHLVRGGISTIENCKFLTNKNKSKAFHPV